MNDARYEIRLNGVCIARFTMREKYEAYQMLARLITGAELVDLLTGHRTCRNGNQAVRMEAA